MSDWRNYEHFKCPQCGKMWQVFSQNSYDGGDSSPHFTEELCMACYEEFGPEEEEEDDAPEWTDEEIEEFTRQKLDIARLIV